jgi:hypothetical protein
MRFTNLAARLAAKLGMTNVGTTGYKASIDGDAIAKPKENDGSRANKRLEEWRARAEPGLEQKPLEEWPPVRIGERVGLLAQSIREVFDDSFPAMARSSVCLMHRAFESGVADFSISAKATGSKDGAQTEDFTLRLRRLAEGEEPQLEDLEEGLPTAQFKADGIEATASLAPIGSRDEPLAKLAPVWADPIFCHNVAKQLREALHVEWSEALGAAAYAVTIFDHMSEDNGRTLSQTAKGLSVESEKDPARVAEMASASYALTAVREETLTTALMAEVAGEQLRSWARGPGRRLN